MRLACLALLAASLCHVTWHHWESSADSWCASHEGHIGVAFTKSAQAFHEFGFCRVSGLPCRQFFPWSPDSHLAYTNHPVVAYWIYSLAWDWGGTRGMRLLSLGVLLLGALGLYLLARRCLDSSGAAVVVAIYLSLPVVVFSGYLTNGFSFAVAALAPLVHSWLLWRETASRRAMAAYCTLAVIAGLTSWYAYALIPGFWVHHLVMREPQAVPRWRFLFWTGFPFGLALLFLICWVACALPAGELARTVEFLVSSVRGTDYYGATFQTGVPGLLRKQWSVGVGIPMLILATLGLVWPGGWKREPVLILLVAGSIHNALFWSRAASHPYWVWFMGPILSFLAGRAVMMLITHRRVAPALALVSLLGLGGLLAYQARDGVCRYEEKVTPYSPVQTRMLEDALPPRSVVFFGSGLQSIETYVRCQVPLLLVSEAKDYRMTLDHMGTKLHLIDHLWLIIESADLKRKSWIKDLPIMLDTLRSIEEEGTSYWVVELDREKVLTQLP